MFINPVACERSFKSSSCWPEPSEYTAASEPKGCPQGQLPSWLAPAKQLERQKCWEWLVTQDKCKWGCQDAVWHPEELIPIQSAITYSLRTQFQSNPRLSFSYCLPYLCTNYLWPQDIQRPDTSCYPQQTLISRNHNPSSVLIFTS